MPEATSAALAAQLLGRLTRPSEAAVRAEAKIRLQEALNAMDPLDREVLALRHFEHLTNAEAAQVLGIKEAAAGKRYLRALERLREILARCPAAWSLTTDVPTRDGCDGRHAMSDSDSDADPLAALAEEFADRLPPRRAARPDRVRRAVPRAGRADPRALPGAGGDGGARLGRGAGDRAGRRPRRPARPAAARSWATTASSARSAGAAWGSSTRPSRSRSAGTWR